MEATESMGLTAILSAVDSTFSSTIGSATKQLDTFNSAITSGISGAADIMNSAGKSLTLGVTTPLIGLATVATKTGMTFEASMSKVRSLSGAVGDDMALLESTARKMGASTRYSASEAADALGYMALAGWDTNQMVKSLPSVLSLATAGSLALADASDILTDTMSMYGLSVEEASASADIFAYAQANSNLSVDELFEALKNVGPAAVAAGEDLESTSAILGVLANNGIKGSAAGTALNAMYQDIQKNAEGGNIAIGNTAVAVYDAEGNMRSMIDIMQDVESATQGMTGEQMNAALSSVFMQRSLRGVNTIMNSGTDSLVELKSGLDGAGGSAEEAAAIMDDNLKGSLASLGSIVEEIGIQFSKMTGGPLREFVDMTVDMLRSFSEMDERIQQSVFITGALLAGLGPVLIILSKVVGAVGVLSGGLGAVSGLFGKAFGGIAGIVSGATSSIGSLAGSFASILPAVGAVPGAAGVALASVTTMASGAAGALTAALTAMIFASIGAFNVAAIAGVAFAAIGAIYLQFSDQIEGFLNMLIEKAPGFITGFADRLVAAIPELIMAGTTLFGSLVEVLTTLGPVILQAGMNIIFALVQGMIDNMATISAGLIEVFSFVANSIGEYLPTFIIMGAQVIMAMLEGITQNRELFSQSIGSLLDGVIEVLTVALPMFLDIGIAIVTLIGNSIMDNLDPILAIAGTLIMVLGQAIWDNLPNLFIAGANIVSTIINGLIDKTGDFHDWAKDLGGPIEDGLSKALPVVLEVLTGLLVDLIKLLTLILPDVVGIIADVVIATVVAIVKSLPAIIDAIAGVLFSIMDGVMVASVNAVVSIVNMLLKWINNIPGVKIDLIPTMKIDEDAMKGYKNFDSEWGDLGDKKITVQDQASSLWNPAQADKKQTWDAGAAKPSNINLNLGGKNFKAFSRDINETNDQHLDLISEY